MSNTIDVIDFIKNEDNKVTFKPTRFIKYLENLGFKKIEFGNNFKIVHVSNYIVTEVQPHEIKSKVLNAFIKDENEPETDYLISKPHLFSLNYLSAIETIKIEMHRDSESESYLYFENGVVKITSESISKPIPYNEFKKYIWKEHIIPHDFTGKASFENFTFYDFLKRLGNNNNEWILRICTTIGYCLNDYKTAATSKAVVITDAEISSKPEGGSGKSLIWEAISRIRKTVMRNGQTFDPSKNFEWDDIDESVRIIAIDDAKANFNFESLFPLITGGFNIEEKYKGKIGLSVEKSPRFIITSNHIIKGGSGSFSRRQITLDVFQYFSKQRTPLSIYKKTFFSEWNELEWLQFFSLMINCIQLYFKNGISEYQETDQANKELIRNTSFEFSEWINENITDLKNGFQITTDKRDSYIYETNQKNISISNSKFLEYIRKYCELNNLNFLRINNGKHRGFEITNHF